MGVVPTSVLMKSSTNFIIIVPVYNEEIDLPLWFESLNRQPWRRRIKRIIVVNDGSTDRTLLVANKYRSQFPLTIISYYPNVGPGEAFRRGLSKALRLASDSDVIVTLECDNTSDLSILLAMVRKVVEGAGVCVASYYTKGGGFIGVRTWRRIISHIGNLVVRVGCGIVDIHTFSSFYRVYRPSVLRDLFQKTRRSFYTENGFACMVELVARLAAQGVRLAEVPMVLVGTLRKGRSKMRVIPTALGYLRVMRNYRR